MKPIQELSGTELVAEYTQCVISIMQRMFHEPVEWIHNPGALAKEERMHQLRQELERRLQ